MWWWCFCVQCSRCISGCLCSLLFLFLTAVDDLGRDGVMVGFCVHNVAVVFVVVCVRCCCGCLCSLLLRLFVSVVDVGGGGSGVDIVVCVCCCWTCYCL